MVVDTSNEGLVLRSIKGCGCKVDLVWCSACVNAFAREMRDACQQGSDDWRSLAPEVIRSAAVRKNGVVYPCWAHTYHELTRLNLDAPEDVLLHSEQGFVTNAGRFVDRSEGLKIAQADGQIIHKHNPLDRLLSEDMRPLPAPPVKGDKNG